MSLDTRWVTTLMAEAQNRNPDVNTAVWDRLEELLIGELSDRQLSSGELKNIASELIADMVRSKPMEEGKQ